MPSINVATNASLQKLQPNEKQLFEKNQISQSVSASKFKLRLDNAGQLTVIDVTRLLQHARISRDYKAHGNNYELKLKTDQQGQYLTFKQQGLWSRFKGVFGIGHETRTQQRAAAMNLINRTFEQKGFSFPTKGTEAANNEQKLDWVNEKAVSFAEAKTYQRKLMNAAGIEEPGKPGKSDYRAPLDDLLENPFVDVDTESQRFSDELRQPSFQHVRDENSESTSQEVALQQKQYVEIRRQLSEDNEYALANNHDVNSQRENSFLEGGGSIKQNGLFGLIDHHD